MREIELTQGKVAIVDDDDYEELNKHKWCYSNQGYAVRHSKTENGKRTDIHMHRVVNNTPSGFETDHVNMNKLDNRKENLRTATPQQNRFNRRSAKNSTSKYKGVSWRKCGKNWVARATNCGKHIFLGYFKEEIEAAIAYNNYAIQRHGEYARLNIIER